MCLWEGHNMKKDSDILEARILDHSYNVIHKTRARVKDRKDMKRLVRELRYKGVKLVDEDSYF